MDVLYGAGGFLFLEKREVQEGEGSPLRRMTGSAWTFMDTRWTLCNCRRLRKEDEFEEEKARRCAGDEASG